MAIKHLKNQQIDAIAWNKCIETAVNGNIFGYSWYLDMVSPNWEAFVEDDYKSVMPLTYKKILGAKILQEPDFTLNHSIYTTQLIDQKLTERFIEAIPDDIKLIDIRLNKYNRLSDTAIPGSSKVSLLELDLISNHQTLRNRYHSWLQKKLDYAETCGYRFISGLQGNEVINLYLKNPKYSFNKVSDIQLKNLRILISLILRSNSGEVIGAYNSKNTLQAAAVLVYSHNNVQLLFLAQSKEAFRAKLLYSMVDFFIKKQSEKNITLSITPIGRISKFFDFKMFGSQITEYYHIYQNRLPLHLRLLYKVLN